jgi:hypothetical protein
MKRQPIYHEDNDSLRVISVANGYWQAQRKHERGPDSRTDQGGWRSISPATTREAAVNAMNVAQAKSHA